MGQTSNRIRRARRPWVGQLTLVMALLGMLALSGCALKTAAPPPEAPAPVATDTGTGGEKLSGAPLTDAERARVRAYMRAVEERAKRRHTRVVWVNPPDGSGTIDPRRLEQIVNGQPPMP